MKFRRYCIALTTLVACTTASKDAPSATQPVLGKQYAYELALSARSDLPQGNTFDFRLKSQVTLTKVAERDGESQFVLGLDEPTLTSERDGAQEELGKLAQELDTAPFVFSIRDGRLAETRMPRTISPTVGAIFQTVASQFQLPSQQVSKPLEVLENDGTGQYAARYSAGATTGTLTKEKLRYGSLIATGKSSQGFTADGLTPTVVESKASLEVQGGILSKCDSFEHLRTAMFGLPTSMETTTTLSLTKVKEQKGPAIDLASVLAKTARFEAGKPFFSAPRKDLFDDVRLQGQSFEQITSALAKSDSDPRAELSRRSPQQGELTDEEKADAQRWAQSRGQSFGALVAAYRQIPGTAQEAIKRVRAGDPISGVLVDGLTSAGTPEAQRALVTIFSDKRVSDESRVEAILSLMRVRNPSSDAVKGMESALQNDDGLEVYAIYGIGTYGRVLKQQGDTATAARLVDRLVDRLGKTTDDAMVIHLLRGISNSGDPRALAKIEPFLKSENDTIRGAAVEGIRLMEHEKVDSLLAAHIESDPSTDVRLLAIESCRTRRATKTLVRALTACAKNDKSRSAKFGAISMLGAWVGDFPEVVTTLKHIAETDQEEATREAARLAMRP